MKKSASILIVEDEPIIADDIALSLEEFGYQITDIVASSEEALSSLEGQQPDIILLDIKIKGGKDGIGLAHLINEKYKIPFVFISSLYDQNTLVRAKKVNPVGYIVKPFKDSDLKVNIELALAKTKMVSQPAENTDLNLFVRKSGSMVPLDYTTVGYAKADDNYTDLFAEDRKHTVSHTLKEIEDKLSKNGFCRIHKTYLVNISKIDRIEQSVVFVGEQMIPIGKAYKKAFFEQLTVL